MTKGKAKKGFVVWALDTVERVGDDLPNPATIFLILTGIVIVLSAICAALGVSVTYDFLDSANDEISQETVQIVNLLTPDSIHHMVTTVMPDFAGFLALGTVFTIMIGVGVADGTGFISALLRKAVTSTPKALVTAVTIFLGIMSNIASSTGYVVLVPLGAILFMAFGRHPVTNLAAAFAGVSGGRNANLLISTNNPILAGMSTQAARMIDPGYTVLPVYNWYFMMTSTFLVTIIETIATGKLVEPRPALYVPDASKVVQDIAENEKCSMRWAGITTLAYMILMAVLVVPSDGLLRNPETHAFLTSPFTSGIIFSMMLLFLLPGLAYGIDAGTVKSDKNAVALMNKTIAEFASFMVLIFFAAQFAACFNYSNPGTIISVSDTNFLQSVGLVGPPLTICFIVLAAFINIFIAVGSAKWAIMAPIFVPMFVRLGLSPELTQVAYRINDSSTNIVAPLMPFSVLTVAFFQKCDKRAGVGSVVSTMLPCSLAFLVGWIIAFAIRYLLGLPLGPGSPMSY